MKQRLAIGALIITQILSGINTPVIREAVQTISPFLFGFFRVGLACVVIVPIALIARSRRSPRKRKIQRKDVALAALGSFLVYAVANLAFYMGVKQTSSINASIIILLWPIMYFLVNVEFLKEKFSRRTFMGISLAFIGALIAVGAPLLSKGASGQTSLVGVALIVACVIVDIIGTLVLKKSLKKVQPLDLLAIGLFVSTLFYAVLAAPHFGELNQLAVPAVRNAILYGALAVGCIGYGLGFFALKTLKSGDYSVINYLQPITAISVAVLFFNETFTPSLLLGTAGVFVGLYLVEARKFSHLHAHGAHR